MQTIHVLCFCLFGNPPNRFIQNPDSVIPYLSYQKLKEGRNSLPRGLWLDVGARHGGCGAHQVEVPAGTNAQGAASRGPGRQRTDGYTLPPCFFVFFLAPDVKLGSWFAPVSF